ncbi:uncharacterized protein C1orf131 homolog [Pomacea canaliculata]|uniref:uncharacterized protein C1orf131 homolog n=1 Tax=Pomacea canaliculata TaxID=400727 RepID=UPI000D73A9B5|nr:uncharacterized protein C1orf131 homolog [Pomacea canaliculata]
MAAQHMCSGSVQKHSSSANKPEIVVYHAPSRKKKNVRNESIPSSSSPKTSAPPEFNLEKARAEIRQLGIQGFTGRTKTEAEIAKLRDLGAKIPKVWVRKMERKKRNINYQRHRQDLRIGVKTKVAKGPEKKDKKISKDDSKFKATIGKVSGGVHFLKEADIKRVMNS